MREIPEYRTGADMREAYVAARERLNPQPLPCKMMKRLPPPMDVRIDRYQGVVAPPRPKPAEEAPPVLAAVEPWQWNKPVNAAFILYIVARAHGVSVAEIRGPRRNDKVVNARFHAIATLHSYRPDLSCPAIGRAIGGRDHSTVMHAVKTWPSRASQFEREIAEVEGLL